MSTLSTGDDLEDEDDDEVEGDGTCPECGGIYWEDDDETDCGLCLMCQWDRDDDIWDDEIEDDE